MTKQRNNDVSTKPTIAPTGATYDLAALAAAPTWPAEALAALPGHVRGVVLARWAHGMRQRFGNAIIEAVRADLRIAGFDDAALPDDPTPRSWLPIGLPTALTTALVMRAYAGEWRALAEPLHIDAVAAIPLAGKLALRVGGVRGVASQIDRIHRAAYDVGEASALLSDGALRVDVRGSALFACPAWQIMQIFALGSMVRLCGSQPGAGLVSTLGEDGATLQVAVRG